MNFFRYDYLRIYNGDKTSTDLLAKLTGNKALNQIGTSIFTSTGSTITVELKSDGSSLEGLNGFNLEYRAGMNALLNNFMQILDQFYFFKKKFVMALIIFLFSI